MNNLDKIRSMTDEELINFLCYYTEPSELNPGYCDKLCKHRDKCDNCPNCLVSDRTIVEDWAMRKVK